MISDDESGRVGGGGWAMDDPFALDFKVFVICSLLCLKANGFYYDYDVTCYSDTLPECIFKTKDVTMETRSRNLRYVPTFNK